MAISAQEVFAETVRALPPTERLRLAALILQDLSDLTTLSLRYAAKLYPEEDELV